MPKKVFITQVLDDKEIVFVVQEENGKEIQVKQSEALPAPFIRYVPDEDYEDDDEDEDDDCDDVYDPDYDWWSCGYGGRYDDDDDDDWWD